MKISREMLDRRMRAFEEACRRFGLKITHQRVELFRAVASSAEHPDAESVHRAVRKRIPMISLDTVYRNLKLLADRGLVSIVGMSQQNVRFDGNAEPHHHFACVKCGLIRDFSAEGIGPLEIPTAAKAFGVPLSLHLEVKGICAACRRKSART